MNLHFNLKTNIEVKSLISKSNAMKCAATEKQCLVDTLPKKKWKLLQKKDEL